MARKEEEKKLSIEEKAQAKVTSFFVKNRVAILIAIAAVVVVVIGLFVILGINSSKAEKLQLQIQDLQGQLSTVLTSEDQAVKDKYVADLKALAGLGGKSYPAVKASYLLGLYYSALDTPDYASAITFYKAAYDAGKTTYLGALALYNLAVVTEENGDSAGALELYNQCYDEFSDDVEYAVSEKALFSSARLYEANGNKDLAKANYQVLADSFSYSEYGKLSAAKLLVL
jgi:tetratricopeptide (TPR) repeat protein